MKPGATINPRASNFSSALPRIPFGRAISTTRPSLSNTSMGASIFAAGSIKWPPWMRREPGLDLSFGMLTLVEPGGAEAPSPTTRLWQRGRAGPPKIPATRLPRPPQKRFDSNETDPLMAAFCRLFQMHQMSGIADDNAFRSGNTRLHGYRAFPSARARIAMRVGTPF